MKNNKYVLNKDFKFENNQIKLLGELREKKLRKPKKLTGSRLGAVLGSDSFRTPFQLGCEMVGLYVPVIEDFFTRAGIVVEKKLRQHVEKKIGISFKSYDPTVINWDVFCDVSDVFGGIPDGEETDANGNIVSILEIKTAQMDKYKGVFIDNQFKLDKSNGKPQVVKRGGGLAKGFKNGEVIIPENYKDQISLYMYLRGVTRGYFCVAFVKEEDYDKPYHVEFISEFNNYKDYDADETIKLPKHEHLLVGEEHNLDLDVFKKKLDIAEEGYRAHILEGISPKMNTQDLDWFRNLFPNEDLI